MKLITQRELERRVVESYLLGLSYNDIQNEFGISTQQLKSILHKHGVVGEKRLMTKACSWRYKEGHVSFRTTIPKPVCKKLGIKDGDLLHWELKNENGELVAVVHKVVPEKVKEKLKKLKNVTSSKATL